MSIDSEILAHCRACREHVAQGNFDSAELRLTLALVLYQQRRFNRQVDNLQRTLKGESNVYPLFATR